MPIKSRSFVIRAAGVLIALFLLQNNLYLQVKSVDLDKKYPEIAGLYEAQIPGAGTIVMQVYFKDGTLRTVENGDRESTKFDPVEGQELKFARLSPSKGTFILEILKNDKGRLNKIRFINEKAKLDVMAVKKADFDDAKADPASPSDRQGYFERHYRKSEQRIPMRDGVRLFTHIFTPIDQSEPHPIIFFRTPYGIAPYGDAFPNTPLPSLSFAKENYIMVFQDIRGMSMSEGTFKFVRPYEKTKKSAADIDESSDAYDSIEWLLKNVPQHNGKVGVWGISYPGFTAAMAAISAHPAVRAVSPQAPMADLFLGDDGHHWGALYLAHYANYVYTMGQVRKAPTTDSLPRLQFPTPDGYSFYLQLGPLKNFKDKIFGNGNPLWDETLAHETYDAYWKANSIYPHLQDIKPAILMVGGWYDAEDLLGTLRTYQTIEKRNPGLRNTLVMGPWRHSGWSYFAGVNENRGVFPFTGTITYFQEKIELPFFNYYLKGKGTLDTPEAVVFETGTDQWRSYDTWPPKESKEKKMFLADHGRVSFDAPPVSSGAGFDEYLSDPAKPVPYTMHVTPRYSQDYFVEDQRFAASRPDVLVYSGEALTEDVTISGPIKAELYVSTTGTDADWVIKVIDVFPDDAPDPKTNPKGIRMGGYQRLIRGDIIRGKFRNSFEKPEPFTPNRVTKVEFELPDVQHAFLKGHRIMVQIQSSWFPLFDRNPQTFCDIGRADEKDFQKAAHRLYRTPQYPSGITMRILEKNFERNSK
jgi:uncharacterized protein